MCLFVPPVRCAGVVRYITTVRDRAAEAQETLRAPWLKALGSEELELLVEMAALVEQLLALERELRQTLGLGAEALPADE